MKIDLEIQPFSTPNFVIPVQKPGTRQEGLTEIPSIPLRDLDPNILELLCDQFREDIFKKAGKDRPHVQKML